MVQLLNDNYAIVQATTSELNEYIGASYLNNLNSVVTSQKVNIKLYITLALVFFLFFGCVGAVVIGRLKDFIQYIIYTDKTTGLPNNQMCDVQINTLSEKELDEHFTCLVIQMTNLAQMNDTLGRSAGDLMLSGFGEILKSLARNYGFIGSNKGGLFIGLFENCTVSKANLFIEMLSKSVEDFNDKQVEIQIQYVAGYSNSTDEQTYDIRSLLRNTFKKVR